MLDGISTQIFSTAPPASPGTPIGARSGNGRVLADGGHTGAAATRLELGSATSRQSSVGDVELPAASTVSTGEPVPEAFKSTGVAAACLEVDSARLRVPSTESSAAPSLEASEGLSSVSATPGVSEGVPSVSATPGGVPAARAPGREDRRPVGAARSVYTYFSVDGRRQRSRRHGLRRLAEAESGPTRTKGVSAENVTGPDARKQRSHTRFYKGSTVYHGALVNYVRLVQYLVAGGDATLRGAVQRSFASVWASGFFTLLQGDMLRVAGALLAERDFRGLGEWVAVIVSGAPAIVVSKSSGSVSGREPPLRRSAAAAEGRGGEPAGTASSSDGRSGGATKGPRRGARATDANGPPGSVSGHGPPLGRSGAAAQEPGRKPAGTASSSDGKSGGATKGPRRGARAAAAKGSPGGVSGQVPPLGRSAAAAGEHGGMSGTSVGIPGSVAEVVQPSVATKGLGVAQVGGVLGCPSAAEDEDGSRRAAEAIWEAAEFVEQCRIDEAVGMPLFEPDYSLKLEIDQLEVMRPNFRESVGLAMVQELEAVVVELDVLKARCDPGMGTAVGGGASCAALRAGQGGVWARRVSPDVPL